jgi:hypothetical protein
MTRREILASAAAAPLAAAAVSVLAAPAIRQGPTMAELVALAENGTDRPYYKRLLDRALRHTGTVVIQDSPREGWCTAYAWEPELPDRTNYTKTVYQTGGVLVPDVMLPYIRPENRGGDFPGRVPFRKLT